MDWYFGDNPLLSMAVRYIVVLSFEVNLSLFMVIVVYLDNVFSRNTRLYSEQMK